MNGWSESTFTAFGGLKLKLVCHTFRGLCPGVAFGAKSTLKTHIETVHEKRRDHACSYCKGVAFGTASDLKKHSNHVHLKIPWPSRRTAAEE